MLGHLHREMRSVIFAPVNHQHPTRTSRSQNTLAVNVTGVLASSVSHDTVNQIGLMCYYGQTLHSLSRGVFCLLHLY